MRKNTPGGGIGMRRVIRKRETLAPQLFALAIGFLSLRAPLARGSDPSNVFPAPAIKKDLASYVGRISELAPLRDALPSYWIQLDGEYPSDPQQIAHVNKVVQSIKDGIPPAELTLGP